MMTQTSLRFRCRVCGVPSRVEHLTADDEGFRCPDEAYCWGMVDLRRRLRDDQLGRKQRSMLRVIRGGLAPPL